MFKIQFWLKKPNDNQENLEYVSISDPKVNKVRDLGWNSYVCEICFSYIEHVYPPIYGTNPIEPLCLALEIVKNNLKGLVAAGYVISEVESKEIWKLEKLSNNYLQEKIDEIRNNKNISQEDKEKILGNLKESFGKTVIGDKLNKAVDKE
jgi:hypothetical protein